MLKQQKKRGLRLLRLRSLFPRAMPVKSSPKRGARSTSPAVKIEEDSGCEDDPIAAAPRQRQRAPRADMPSPAKKAPKMSAIRRRVITSSLVFGLLALLVPALCTIEVYATWLRPCAQNVLDAEVCVHYQKLVPIAPSFVFAIATSCLTLALSALHFAARLSLRYSAAAFPQPLVLCILGMHVISATCALLLTDAASRVGYLSAPLAASLMAVETLQFFYYAVIFFVAMAG